jgi:hypothetical protein
LGTLIQCDYGRQFPLRFLCRSPFVVLACPIFCTSSIVSLAQRLGL